MFERMKSHLEGRFYEIDCVFEVDGAGGAKPGRAARRARPHPHGGEDAVRQGYGHLILTDERVGRASPACP